MPQFQGNQPTDRSLAKIVISLIISTWALAIAVTANFTSSITDLAAYETFCANSTSTMDRAAYEAFYANLSLHPGQTRLVRVHPAESWDDPVVCDMAVVDIAQSPPYNAISYTWGGQSPEYTVLCNGHEILVTQSCIDALKGVRSQSLPIVWIDQLSINQFDQKEKNSQVLFMHEIYTNAKIIYISLGNWESRLAEESECFRESIEVDPAGQARRTFSYPVPQGDGTFQDLKLTGPVSAVHASFAVANELLKELAAYIFSETRWELLQPLGAVPTAWKIVADILSNPYWRRKWIVQEIALGADIQVMISQFTVRWEAVLGAYVMVNRIVHPIVGAEEDEQRFRQNAQPYLGLLKDMAHQQTSCLLTIGQAIMALQERDLSQILLRLARPSTLKTSWDIDAVYSVRALMKDFGDIPAPRYEQEPGDAFVEYSRWFVEHGYGAEILIARTYDGISLGLQERPTWSINWSSQHMTITKETLSYSHSYFHGKRNSSAECTRMSEMKVASEHITLVAGSDKLRITGSVIDRVVEALPQPEGCKSSITFEQACDFILQARSRRSEDDHTWIKEYLTYSQRPEQKYSYMKDHRALIESLEGMTEKKGDEFAYREAENAARELLTLEDSMMHHFTLLMSERGWSGIGPEHMKQGDLLITVAGLPTVFVLRKEETIADEYILVGQAEVIAHADDHGIALAISREQREFVVD